MWQIFLGVLALANAAPIEDDLVKFGSVGYYHPVPNQIVPYGTYGTYGTPAAVPFFQAFPSLYRYQTPGVAVAPAASVQHVPLTYGAVPRVHVTQVQPAVPSGGQVSVVNPVATAVVPSAVGQPVFARYPRTYYDDDDDDDDDERKVVIPVQYSVPSAQSGFVTYYRDDDDDDEDDERIVQYTAGSPYVRAARYVYYDDDDDDDDGDDKRKKRSLDDDDDDDDDERKKRSLDDDDDDDDDERKKRSLDDDDDDDDDERKKRSLYDDDDDGDDDEYRRAVPVPYSAPKVYYGDDDGPDDDGPDDDGDD